MRMMNVIFAVLGLSGICAAESTVVQYLSGKDKDTAVAWDFFCSSGNNSGKWTTIPVPSNWEFHGFGEHTYWSDGPIAAQGKYRCSFQIPAEWARKRVFVVFEGAMTDTEVWINGQSAGPKHQGAFYRFKYEITPFLTFGGANLLEATVDRKSSESSVNAAERDADYWVFGGIYRPVYLEAQPQQFVERVAINAKADGSFEMKAFVNGLGTANGIEAEIRPVVQGKTVDAVTISAKGALRADKATVQTKVLNPKLWTAETPNLYEVIVRLTHGEELLHEIKQRFGFRTIEIKPGDGIYLNGTRILFKGVCRHSFWPDSGRCLNRSIHEMDLNLIKDMNMNAVRMSHYPPDREFLDLCDEMGVYVLDELAGGGGKYQQFGGPGYKTEVGRKLVEAMVTRDVNHPSILIWDNGNEGGWNKELDNEFAKWDPQGRAVIHPFEIMGGLNTEHYPCYDRLQDLLKGNQIYFPTEFLHGLFDGGHGAGLADFWAAMRQSKISAGGFLWVLFDEGVTTEKGFIDVVGDKAPDGIVGPYRQKEGSYFAIKEIWSPIVIDSSRTPYQSGRIQVENRYEFTNLKDCRFEWRLRKFTLPGVAKTGSSILAQGTWVSPDVAPGTTGDVKIELPAEKENADVLALTAKDPSGREVLTWVWTLTTAPKIRETIMAKESQVAVSGSEDEITITLTGGGTVARIAKASGELVSVQANGRDFSFKNGPRLAVGEAKVSHISHRQDGAEHVVEVRYSGNMKTVVWRLSGNGWLKLDYVYELVGSYPFMGVSFDYPEAKMRSLKWLGEGPYRVWKNRMAGTSLDVWENVYNNTLTGQSRWVYPEFRGYFSNVRWAQLKTAEGPITMVLDQDNKFFRILGWYRGEGHEAKLTPTSPNPDWPAANNEPKEQARKNADKMKKNKSANVNPPFPAGDISFLDGVPGIGTKNFTAESSGPAGQWNVAGGIYVGTIYFRFGE